MGLFLSFSDTRFVSSKISEELITYETAQVDNRFKKDRFSKVPGLSRNRPQNTIFNYSSTLIVHYDYDYK